MIIRSIHGYFTVEETSPGEIGKFSSVYDVDFAALSDGSSGYTFPFLLDAEKFSLIGKAYLNLPAVKMFEGSPGEIFRENGFVYDLGLDLIRPVVTVLTVIEDLPASDFYYTSTSLVQPGSLLKSGKRIVDYTAWFDFRTSSFKYTEIGFL